MTAAAMTFAMTWPVLDDDVPYFDLVAQATEQLAAAARGQGVRLVGEPLFRLEHDPAHGPVLRVEVPAQIAVPGLAAQQRRRDLGNVRRLLATGMTPQAIREACLLPGAYIEDLLLAAAARPDENRRTA